MPLAGSISIRAIFLMTYHHIALGTPKQETTREERYLLLLLLDFIRSNITLLHETYL